jgi:phenylacetate-CoA ligase
MQLEPYEAYRQYHADRLFSRVQTLSETSPFYRRLMRRVRRDLLTERDRDLGDLIDKVPFTLKDDLRRNFPYGFMAVERDRIIAYHESSGTSDGSIHSSRSMSLRTSLDIQNDGRRRIPEFIGAGAGMTAIVNLPFALTSSATGFYSALQNAGYTTVAADQGQFLSSYTRVADLLRALEASVLVTSDPLLLRDVAIFDTGTDILKDGSLKWILCVGVPLSRARRDWIRTRFGISVLSYYGLSEFGAVGVPDESGRVYVHDDFFVEVLNPRDAHALAGELVIWDLTSEGSPLLRYQTGDVGRIEPGWDPQGAPRLYLEVLGRVSEVIFDGANFVLPATVQDLFIGLENLSPVHRVSVEGDNRESMTMTLDVQLYDALDRREVAVLESRARVLTTIPIEIRTHKFGDLFPELYRQDLYRNAQSAKSLAFHDKRRGQWVVTY